MKFGNILEKIFIVTGIKWLHKKIVFDWLKYESCGCDDRKEYLNNLTINRNGNKKNA